MALGSTHRKFNILTGVIYSVLIVIFSSFDWEAFGCFLICFTFGTFILSPDIDLGPNRFAGISKFFIYPYSFIFKHRGISHSIFLGTLSRVLYGLVFLAIIFLISDQFKLTNNSFKNLFEFMQSFVLHFNYAYWPHKWLIWCYVGLFLSDFSHVLLDSLSGIKKKLF